MSRFFYQISLFTLLVIIVFGLLLSLAGGNTDPYYERFTSPAQNNLILGTSRAAQGLQPEVFKKELDRSFLNYSFTVAHSPFGPTYLESIDRKLNDKEQNGIFIITVDPWSISSTTSDPNDSTNFREVELCLGNTSMVNMNPNFIYLIKNLKGNYTQLLPQKKSRIYLHADGWLEVTVDMDSVLTNQRTKDRVERYRQESLPIYKYSSLRLDYLKKTVELLNKHGRVYLVRLPMHPSMMQIEDELMPDFSSRLESVISLTEGYYDLTTLNAEYKYTDGNHLDKESGKVISGKIARWITSKQASLQTH